MTPSRDRLRLVRQMMMVLKTKMKVEMFRAAFFLAAAIAAVGCDGSSSRAPRDGDAAKTSGPVWFEDVTERVRVSFVHDAGTAGSHFMPECVGSGVALFDYDGDDRLDLYLVQNGGPESSSKNVLLHQEKDGTFKDVSAGSGLDVAGRGMGVAVGDVNNDGRVDVFVTEHGRIRLFRNDGGGKFSDVSQEAGIASPLWATSAAFFDYDRDGWLDLVVTNYINYDPSRWCADSASQRDYCGPDAFRGTVTKLLHNLGAQPGAKIRFADVTLAAGLTAAPGPGLGVICLDFDRDRWPDILIANDGKPNHLWINQRNGKFVEDGIARGIALNSMGKTEANMGIAVGDVDGDGAFDLFVTHLTDETPTLWKQMGDGLFEDATASSGLANPEWRGTGFGTVMVDFDGDGALDIAAVNGRVTRGDPGNHAVPEPSLAPHWKAYVEADQLFHNDGTGKFADVSPANHAFCRTAGVSRGVAAGDLDGDGAVDLVVTQVSGPAKVFKNIGQKGHWLLVRTVDPALRRDAYGAEVTVHAGEERYWRAANPAYSYLCSNDPRVHFGLGSRAEVDSISVIWPDGSEERFPGGAVDRSITLEKGSGVPLGRGAGE